MLSMRVIGALGLAVVAGTAQASSLVFVGQKTAAPSVVSTNAVEGAKTPSIVALGEKLANVNGNVTDEKVAAIPSQPSHGLTGSPMIIRGGIVGDAFATPAPKTAPVTAAAPAADSKADPKVASKTPEPAAPQPAPLAAPDQPK
jgi:uncharacterized protein YcfJ